MRARGGLTTPATTSGVSNERPSGRFSSFMGRRVRLYRMSEIPPYTDAELPPGAQAALDAVANRLHAEGVPPTRVEKEARFDGLPPAEAPVAGRNVHARERGLDDVP